MPVPCGVLLLRGELHLLLLLFQPRVHLFLVPNAQPEEHVGRVDVDRDRVVGGPAPEIEATKVN